MTHDDRSPLDYDLETMRRLGRRVADQVAEHLASVREQPVTRSLSRAEAEALIAHAPREEGADVESLLAWLDERVLPYHAREPHPGFVGYVPSCPSFPAVLGDWLATGYNFFCGVWPIASGPNQLELTVLDWFREWIGMPAGAGGLLTSGGSAATLTAVVAARHRALAPTGGLGVDRLTMYASDQAHSSVARAAWTAGIAREHVRVVESDEHFRLRPDALAGMLANDRAAGLQPFCVVASAGTTNTGAVDPLPALAELCARERLWLHVDAAYAGFAVLTERGRRALAGLERADSVTLDPHKWLFVPFECGCLLARDPAALPAAFRITPEYLRDVERYGAEVNFADYGEQLTRYARALKVWLGVRAAGLAALRAEMDRAMDLALEAQRLVLAHPEMEVLAPAQFGVVCFRAHPAGVDDPAALDALNERINARVNGAARWLASSTRLRGAYSLRLCVLGFRTRAADVAAVVEAMLEAAREEMRAMGVAGEAA